MANEQNLRPFTSDQSHEEAVKNGRKGGKKSGEAKRRRKTFAEAFDAWLSADHKDKNGNKMNGMDILTSAMIQKAARGDVRAFEVIRDSVGEKPIDKIATVDIPDDVRNKVESLVNDYESKSGVQNTD